MICAFCLKTKQEVEKHKEFLIEAKEGLCICSACVKKFHKQIHKVEPQTS